jgi:hypothetical protein
MTNYVLGWELLRGNGSKLYKRWGSDKEIGLHVPMDTFTLLENAEGQWNRVYVMNVVLQLEVEVINSDLAIALQLKWRVLLDQHGQILSSKWSIYDNQNYETVSYNVYML